MTPCKELALGLTVCMLGNVVGTPHTLASVFINELHYDNTGADTGEFVEIAGPAGTDLSDWKLVLYNGNGGSTYGAIELSGIIDNEWNGFGAVEFFRAGIQNGALDGLALLDATGAVAEFLSYEGTLTATNGPANGLTSTDMGVSESSSTPVGHSLQLTGTGSESSHFAWNGPAEASPGSLNSGQTFSTTIAEPVSLLVWIGMMTLALIGRRHFCGKLVRVRIKTT